MKLFYCTGLFFPARIANRTTIMKTCEALRRAGVDITLFASSLSESESEVFAFYGVRDAFPIRMLQNMEQGRFKSWFYARMYKRILETEKPDIVYLREPKLAFCMCLLMGKKLNFVYEIHNEGPDFISKILHRYLLPRATGVVCITKSMQIALEKKYAFLHGRIVLAAMAFDPKLFPVSVLPDTAIACRELRFNPAQPVILYVGSTLDEWKGFTYLMDAAGILPESQFVVLGGNQASIAKWQAYALAHNIHNVRFEGYITKKAPYYGAATALVATTNRDPNDTGDSPMKIFEYMATGKPIVAMAGIVVKEVLTHKHNAVLVTERSAEALAAGISAVLNDTAAAQRYAQQAIVDSAKHSWDARAQVIKEFIQKIHDA